MNEQGSKKRKAPIEQAQHPLVSPLQSTQTQLALPLDAPTLPAIQEPSLHPDRSIAQPSLEHPGIAKRRQSTSQDVPTGTTIDKPLSQSETEPLPVSPAKREEALSPITPSRLRRSRETTA